MTPEEIMSHPDPQPLRTEGLPMPTCEHRICVEKQCAACDEIDRLAMEPK